MVKKGSDRRVNHRYELSLPIHYRVSAQGATSRWSTSVTCDFSSGDISFRSRRRLPEGAHVEMVIDWPARQDRADSTELLATGFVVRSTASRVAVRINSHRFRIALTRAIPMGETA